MLLCVPTARFERASVATRSEERRVGKAAGPSSANVTVPVGVPDPGETAVTVAVNDTNWPKTDVFTVRLSAVAELALLTVCDTALDVEVRTFESPLYAAVMLLCVPTARFERASVATPLPFPARRSSDLPSTVNVTVPVGVPDP